MDILNILYSFIVISYIYITHYLTNNTKDDILFVGNK